MHHPTDRITHTTGFVTPVVAETRNRQIQRKKDKQRCVNQERQKKTDGQINDTHYLEQAYTVKERKKEIKKDICTRNSFIHELSSFLVSFQLNE